MPSRPTCTFASPSPRSSTTRPRMRPVATTRSTTSCGPEPVRDRHVARRAACGVDARSVAPAPGVRPANAKRPSASVVPTAACVAIGLAAARVVRHGDLRARDRRPAASTTTARHGDAALHRHVELSGARPPSSNRSLRPTASHDRSAGRVASTTGSYQPSRARATRPPRARRPRARKRPSARVRATRACGGGKVAGLSQRERRALRWGSRPRRARGLRASPRGRGARPTDRSRRRRGACCGGWRPARSPRRPRGASSAGTPRGPPRGRCRRRPCARRRSATRSACRRPSCRRARPRSGPAPPRRPSPSRRPRPPAPPRSSAAISSPTRCSTRWSFTASRPGALHVDREGAERRGVEREPPVVAGGGDPGPSPRVASRRAPDVRA